MPPLEHVGSPRRDGRLLSQICPTYTNRRLDRLLDVSRTFRCRAPQGVTTIVRPFEASLIVEFRPDLLKTGFVVNFDDLAYRNR